MISLHTSGTEKQIGHGAELPLNHFSTPADPMQLFELQGIPENEISEQMPRSMLTKKLEATVTSHGWMPAQIQVYIVMVRTVLVESLIHPHCI